MAIKEGETSIDEDLEPRKSLTLPIGVELRALQNLLIRFSSLNLTVVASAELSCDTRLQSLIESRMLETYHPIARRWSIATLNTVEVSLPRC